MNKKPIYLMLLSSLFLGGCNSGQSAASGSSDASIKLNNQTIESNKHYLRTSLIYPYYVINNVQTWYSDSKCTNKVFEYDSGVNKLVSTPFQDNNSNSYGNCSHYSTGCSGLFADYKAGQVLSFDWSFGFEDGTRSYAPCSSIQANWDVSPPAACVDGGACGITESITQYVLPAINWYAGDNVVNSKANYETKGVASSNALIGARNDSMSWVDVDNNLWLFGGYGYASTGTDDVLNDLWKYNPTTMAWTWMSGSNMISAKGVYGIKGLGATTNIAGARFGGVSWKDSNDNLWLFGGYGFGSGSTFNYLNDLWKYNIKANTWTWVGGSNVVSAKGVYGTKGVASINNIAGARTSAMSWVDSSGNVWIFGGEGYATGSTRNILNDLWKYNPTTNEWTWVNGSNVTGAKGVYGTKGVANASNIAGARYGATTWIDKTGNFWLFGGYGYTTTSTMGDLNDLWKYNPTTNEWTWMSGSNLVNQKGVYGTLADESANNVVGARVGANGWNDVFGYFWLTNGSGYDSAGKEGSLNDLWRYDTVKNVWTWVAGSNLVNQKGVYGIQGKAMYQNMQGARYGATSVRDNNGNLWLFGGYGYDAGGTKGYLNDLRMLKVDREAVRCAAVQIDMNKVHQMCVDYANKYKMFLEGNEQVSTSIFDYQNCKVTTQADFNGMTTTKGFAGKTQDIIINAAKPYIDTGCIWQATQSITPPVVMPQRCWNADAEKPTCNYGNTYSCPSGGKKIAVTCCADDPICNSNYVTQGCDLTNENWLNKGNYIHSGVCTDAEISTGAGRIWTNYYDYTICKVGDDQPRPQTCGSFNTPSI